MHPGRRTEQTKKDIAQFFILQIEKRPFLKWAPRKTKKIDLRKKNQERIPFRLFQFDPDLKSSKALVRVPHSSLFGPNMCMNEMYDEDVFGEGKFCARDEL